MKSFALAFIAGLLPAAPAFGAISIDVGNHPIVAGKAGQVITLSVSGTDAVTGFDLRAQIGNGSGPSPQPVFQAVNFTGGIWDAWPAITTGGLISGYPQYAEASVDFSQAGETVTDQGALVHLTIDTTGVAPGKYALLLSATGIGEDSAFIGPGGAELPTTTIAGTLDVRIPGDGNGDGVVNGADFLIWQVGYGKPNPTAATGDYNGDSVVNNDDLLIWKANYGQTASASLFATAPEPVTAALMGLGALAFARRRK